MRRFYAKTIVALVGLLCAGGMSAATFDLPAANDSLIGKEQTIRVGMSDLPDIMQKYDIGYQELANANPGVNIDQLSGSQHLVIPSEFLLPDAPRKNIVINVAEMRLYYYPPNQTVVMTFPVGIGKQGRMTPTGTTNVTDKAPDPEWNPTPQVRDDFLRINGYPLPQLVMPGPDNPLGKFAIRLGFPDILIHGSIDPVGIGQRSSAGCIRMFNQDIGSFFPTVVPGRTKVTVVYQPYIAAWSNGKLYFEANSPVQDYVTPDYKAVIAAAIKDKKVSVDWDRAAQIVKAAQGMPEVISQ